MMTINNKADVQTAMNIARGKFTRQQYAEIRAGYAKRFGHKNATDAAVNKVAFSIINGGDGRLIAEFMQLIEQEFSRLS